jgi:hypothetical protein
MALLLTYCTSTTMFSHVSMLGAASGWWDGCAGQEQFQGV